MKNQNTRKMFFPLLATTVAMALALMHPHASHAQAQPLPTKPPTMNLNAPLPSNLFVELAKAVNPAVVNISTSVTPQNYQRDPMMDLFERFYGIPAPQQRRGARPQQALGTGFIIREDGLIITNAHVVRGADVITIQLDEGAAKTYDAKVLGSDDRSDIALLKIQPDGKLPTVTLGSSENTQVGEWVAAFGNPFGHGHSMTKGIISSKGRSLEEINKFPLLQTDASINPGNSGGPLVNAQGLVIGVNSAIDARAQGIGFAIPIDEVKRILPELETRGKLRKGYLGVGLADIMSYADEESVGAGIVKIEKGGPADKAGLRLYDTVIEYNGKKIRNTVELIDSVADTAPGNKATLKYIRQEGTRQKTLSTNVIVGERTEATAAAPRARNSAPKGQTAPFGLGFDIVDLNADLRDSWDLPTDLKKPVVISVDQGSVAAFVGLRMGDVILEVNKSEVNTAAEAVKQLKKGENILKIARGNRIMILSMKKDS